jgi:predicted nucleic acid-binding protein
MSDRLRVVIDTNLVLSSLVFGGSTARLRLAWQSDRKYPQSPTLKFFVSLHREKKRSHKN